jgi:hypothetical protein
MSEIELFSSTTLSDFYPFSTIFSQSQWRQDLNPRDRKVIVPQFGHAPYWTFKGLMFLKLKNPKRAER